MNPIHTQVTVATVTANVADTAIRVTPDRTDKDVTHAKNSGFTLTLKNPTEDFKPGQRFAVSLTLIEEAAPAPAPSTTP